MGFLLGVPLVGAHKGHPDNGNNFPKRRVGAHKGHPNNGNNFPKRRMWATQTETKSGSVFVGFVSFVVKTSGACSPLWPSLKSATARRQPV